MIAAKPIYVYVGTYTERLWFVDGKGRGIYVFTLDPASGALNPVSLAGDVVSPALLAVAPNRRFLFSVNECERADGKPGGAVSAFAIDPSSGTPSFLNRQPSHGLFPCFVSVDRTSSLVVVGNHESGSIACYPVEPDGRLGEASDVIQHAGSSVHPQHQRGPHVHSVNFDPTDRYLLVCDKGTDRVVVYRVDLANGKLLPNDPPHASFEPGSGPRHLAFHPSGRHAFVINELNATLTALRLDITSGTLRVLQTLPTLPGGYAGPNYTADVHVHPNGRFVYGSNRGHDSLAIFEFDASSEQLTALGHEPTRGAVPRAFGIDPSGKLLLAANQNSDTIVAFRIEETSGALTPTGAVTRTPTPVCVRFVQG